MMMMMKWWRYCVLHEQLFFWWAGTEILSQIQWGRDGSLIWRDRSTKTAETEAHKVVLKYVFMVLMIKAVVHKVSDREHAEIRLKVQTFSGGRARLESENEARRELKSESAAQSSTAFQKCLTPQEVSDWQRVKWKHGRWRWRSGTHLQGPHQSVCWLRPKRARHFLGEPGSEHNAKHAQNEEEEEEERETRGAERRRKRRLEETRSLVKVGRRHPGKLLVAGSSRAQRHQTTQQTAKQCSSAQLEPSLSLELGSEWAAGVKLC